MKHRTQNLRPDMLDLCMIYDQFMTNFIFAKPKGLSAKDLFTRLRKQNIITRWFDTKDCRNWLRITIGTESEMEKFISSTRAIIKKYSQ